MVAAGISTQLMHSRLPAANSAPGQPAHWLSFRSWFVLVMLATSSSDGFLGRCDDLDYDGIEAKAQAARRGLWSAPAAVKRPWDVMEASNDGEP